MLTVPEDLVGSGEHPCVQLRQGTVTDYVGKEAILSTLVLVSQPTLVLVRSGVKQLASRDSDQVQTALAGSLVAFRSGTHLMSEFRAEDDIYRSFVVSLDRSFLREAIGKSHGSRKGGHRAVVSPLTNDVRKRLYEMPSTIGTLSSDTDREFRLREFVVTAMGDPAVRSLLYDEVAEWESSVGDRISSIVNAHCFAPLRVEDLASLTAMSLASFKRHFKSIYGVAPGEWLQETRLQHARELAISSSLPVSEICLACGYQDVSSFTRAFRRRHGRTPSTFR